MPSRTLPAQMLPHGRAGEARTSRLNCKWNTERHAIQRGTIPTNFNAATPQYGQNFGVGAEAALT